MKNLKYKYSSIMAMTTLTLLSGCTGGMLDPEGPVAQAESNLIVTSTLLMLLVVIPVTVLALFFAWKYRESNKKANYDPTWNHSTKVEIVIWLIPIIIIAILSWLAVKETHRLDPYRSLDLQGQEQQKPLVIEAISLDWKWLFVYPEQNVATINEIKFPANRPVEFKITSDTVFNSLLIPQLGGQMYAMAGMDTRLNLLASKPGLYKGVSGVYSGIGYAKMHFKAYALESQQEFDQWIEEVKKSDKALDATAYKALTVVPDLKHAKDPSVFQPDPVSYYSSVTPKLFAKIIDRYMVMRGGEHKMDRGVAEPAKGAKE